MAPASKVAAAVAAVCLVLLLLLNQQAAEANVPCDACDKTCNDGCARTAEAQCRTVCRKTPSACKTCKLVYSQQCFEWCKPSCMISCVRNGNKSSSM